MKNVLFVVTCSLLVGCGPRYYVGEVGAVGASGANGHSAVFQQLATDASVCPAGGYVMSAGVDLNDDGSLQTEETRSVVTLCNGERGTTGAVGAQGAKGSTGNNATPVTPVKLCPGVSTYPTVFVEYALCAGGNLYAVYSANGGFLTAIPPGTYSSNAIGSSCGFTVLTNCKVTSF